MTNKSKWKINFRSRSILDEQKMIYDNKTGWEFQKIKAVLQFFVFLGQSNPLIT